MKRSAGGESCTRHGRRCVTNQSPCLCTSSERGFFQPYTQQEQSLSILPSRNKKQSRHGDNKEKQWRNNSSETEVENWNSREKASQCCLLLEECPACNFQALLVDYTILNHHRKSHAVLLFLFVISSATTCSSFSLLETPVQENRVCCFDLPMTLTLNPTFPRLVLTS